MAVFPRCCCPPSSSSSYGEHTKSPGKRHSLRRAKRGACNWLRSSSITSEQTVFSSVGKRTAWNPG
ncbi:hypothetical protein POJ06DRAFT_250215 [Lipomyces tetrasporus]|uniref:Uncharacterized protein n=1 Tax=Lipomyces tetrasporus TaxID=54092 RepID=A0AAD7VUB6_9ASCO|nr:uncharacterized protein POJ06DRAFT_250215 [Lipomyces tetrasporus]KAJ8101020.1 hypothetical protein POJ06DRAFT_250215 [Lipomyces tetrasporus]